MPKFTKKSRILNEIDFKTILDTGQKVVCQYFVMIGKKTEKAEKSRLGVIVSKKVGNSVIRNKVKRRIREIYRKMDIPLILKETTPLPVDFVVIARKGAVGSDYYDLTSAFERCVYLLIKKLG